MIATEPDEIVTIESLEEIVALQPVSTRRRTIGERLSILFVLKGNGRCLQGGEVLVLEEKTVYTGILDCFQQFEIEEGATGYLVAIDPNKLGTIFESVTIAYQRLFAVNQPCLRLDGESAEEMNWLVTKILIKARSKEKYKIDIVQKYVSL